MPAGGASYTLVLMTYLPMRSCGMYNLVLVPSVRRTHTCARNGPY